MNCKFCNAHLSAGDISVFPKDKDLKEIEYKLICRECDTIQENVVFEKDGSIFVID